MIDTYIVHYKKLINRKKELNKSLLPYNSLNKIFIDEYDRDTMSDIDMNQFCKHYSKAIAANFLSHKKAWELLIESNKSHALILDDDAYFTDDFETVLTKSFDTNYDFCFLGSCCNLHDLSSNIGFTSTIRSRCAHCYIISAIGAKKALNFIKYKIINLPIDGYMNYMFKYSSFTVLEYNPPVSFQTSEIDNNISSLREEDRIMTNNIRSDNIKNARKALLNTDLYIFEKE
jgi:GR25 family glycosyltransferase involved in LPS biosynthesis